MIPLGPFVTLAIWLVITVAIIRHNAHAAERGGDQLPWFELVPIVVAIAMIQLLLDLHRAHLGDAVALTVHTIALAVIWLRRRR